ncbi:MAG: redoxin domain-containing protein [Halobacteriota archaeon]
MVEVDDTAPEFTAPVVTADEVSTFSLDEALEDGAVVLAFFPAAFTGGCREELCDFRDSLAEFEDVDASVYGVSVDGPFSLQEFAGDNDFGFALVSDFEREVIESYDVKLDSLAGIYGPVAKRSVFVIDADGVVRYRWVSDDPSVLPDVDEIREAVEEL